MQELKVGAASPLGGMSTPASLSTHPAPLPQGRSLSGCGGHHCPGLGDSTRKEAVPACLVWVVWWGGQETATMGGAASPSFCAPSPGSEWVPTAAGLHPLHPTHPPIYHLGKDAENWPLETSGQTRCQ